MFCFSLLPVIAVVLVVVRSSVLRFPSVVAVSWLSAASFPFTGTSGTCAPENQQKQE
ncbi:hypothetical protein [Bacteroides thetaiotaomicron]|uniref:hypothetical protein n=1 Tax=Bacteroides thetaiotaomicron TaxID=818 RepID=UPI0021642DE1|nr:hypothetical protein [Bacteroides thetaiotaomicron]UVR90673.1 hypothetical protein NXV61_22225 [Bacteroides thetaiotaomicron]